MKKSNLIFIVFFNLFLLIAVMYINFLAISLPLNGKSTGELSDKYPNLFVPAGLTFSIWSLIYLLLIIFISYHVYKLFNDASFIEKTFKSFIIFSITSILNIAWIFAWHYEKILISTFIMLAFLISLISIFLSQIKISKEQKLSIAYTIPIQFYLGWISVATIANITALLVHYGIVGSVLNQVIWTIVMMSIGGLLGVLMLLKYNAIAYSLVIVWAYIGIIIKRNSSIPIHNEIIIAAYIIIGIIAILMVRSVLVLLKRKTA